MILIDVKVLPQFKKLKTLIFLIKFEIQKSVVIVEDLVFENDGWWAYGQKQLQQSVFVFKLYVQ